MPKGDRQPKQQLSKKEIEETQEALSVINESLSLDNLSSDDKQLLEEVSKDLRNKLY